MAVLQNPQRSMVMEVRPSAVNSCAHHGWNGCPQPEHDCGPRRNPLFSQGEQGSGFDGLMPPMPIDVLFIPFDGESEVGQVGRPFQNVQWSSSFSHSPMIRWTSSPVQKP